MYNATQNETSVVMRGKMDSNAVQICRIDWETDESFGASIIAISSANSAEFLAVTFNHQLANAAAS
jgi:hypothetical protein